MSKEIDMSKVAKEIKKVKKIVRTEYGIVKTEYGDRNWKHFLHEQKYADCQVISAINALYYLTGKKRFRLHTKGYENLVDLAGARHGSAISMNKVRKKLGLKIIAKYSSLGLIKYSHPDLVIDGRLPLPIEASINHKCHRNHSVLIIDHDPKIGVFRLCNCKHAVSYYPPGWIFEEDLERILMYTTVKPHAEEHDTWNFKLL